jgi:hypothetical protein
MIKRTDDVVCDLHCARGDEERGFLGLASKPRSTVYPGLGSRGRMMLYVIYTVHEETRNVGFLV